MKLQCMMKRIYESPLLETWTVRFEENILSGEQNPNPWGGEGAGDEDTPGF